MKRTPKFAVKQGNDGLWYYHLLAGNGKIVMDGAEGYASKGNAERALARTVVLVRHACVQFGRLN